MSEEKEGTEGRKRREKKDWEGEGESQIRGTKLKRKKEREKREREREIADDEQREQEKETLSSKKTKVGWIVIGKQAIEIHTEKPIYVYCQSLKINVTPSHE